MVYGPCGGVRHDGGCEVASVSRCVFLDDGLPGEAEAAMPRKVSVAGPVPGVTLGGRNRPLLVADLQHRSGDAESVRTAARLLVGVADAVLVGDHGSRHPGDFSPVHTAALVLEAGVKPWVTLSCRSADRHALRSALADLRDLGVAGVHCVTGDWLGAETAVFDLDAVRLVELAAATGLPVSVAASPDAPPVSRRAQLLAAKAAAGATVCFVNHCGGPGVVGPFTERAAAEGVELTWVPCVAVATDPAAVAGLARLPGVEVDASVARAAEGGELASQGAVVRAAQAMLAVPRVAGVNLSGAVSSGDPMEAAVGMAAIVQRLRAQTSGGTGDG
jgi:methylenetetrahydrofolate reductase (NADPH)